MIGWLIRILFVLAGAVTSLFISKDALNFAVIQTMVVVILITLIITIIAFWPSIKKLFNRS